MPTLQQIRKELIAKIEKESKFRFEKKPTVSYGREAKTSTREDKKGRISVAKIVLPRKLSQHRVLLRCVLAHELRENLGFQNYESATKAHQAGKKWEYRCMGKRKGELQRKARELFPEYRAY